MRLSFDQKQVLTALMDWLEKPDTQYITVGGYAGTGKSSLIAELKEKLMQVDKDLSVAFVSYTAKATEVLKEKLMESTVLKSKDSVSTIHSLIYTPLESGDGEIIGWVKKDEMKSKLIIIDEASMVNKAIFHDLLSYNVPIIAFGDHGQLPPIEGQFNLMDKPRLCLSEIHRQEENDPIIQVSKLARETGQIPFGKYGKHVIKYNLREAETEEIVNAHLSNITNDTLVLSGYNHTRVKLNQIIRQNLGFSTEYPQVGDRVVCLRNNHKKQIYNSMLGKISSISAKDENRYKVCIDTLDSGEQYRGNILKEQFNAVTPINFTKNRYKTLESDLFDFGYALTVHKAQGSEAGKVILFEERFSKMTDHDWKRWLYTAVTRAKKELIIFSGEHYE